MKYHIKRLLSISSSLLIAAQQCFIAMPAAAVDTPSEAETYAQHIGLELRSSEAENALSELIDINNSGLTVAVDDRKNVKQINGILSDGSVEDSSDAKAIIAKTSELLGIDNVNREIRLADVFESEFNRIYTFKQFYQGLEMINSYITVVVDKETGGAEYLNSSVIPDFSIDVTPAITAQQALEAVIAKYGQASCTSHDLAVYSNDNEAFRLVWKLDTDLVGEDVFYVDAVTAEIYDDIEESQEDVEDTARIETSDNKHSIYYNSLIMDWANKILPESAYCFDIDIARSGDEFVLHDTQRNLYLIDDPSFYAYSDGGTYVKVTKSPEYTIRTSDGQLLSQENQCAAAVLYNVERIYDFYNSRFGYRGYDGEGSEMYIVPTLKFADSDGSNKGPWSNASSNGNRICFGEGNGTDTQHYGSDFDVVAHEFTHSVTRNKVSWGGSGAGETGSLNEAYSDILAEYADNTREWQHSTDRYIKNKGKNTCEPKELCGRDMREMHVYVDSEETRRIGSHAGSLIISNVAYYMDMLGIEATTAAKIWFTSLDYLPKGTNAATFRDCRDAVVTAASKVLRNKARDICVKKIKTAFNRVHIFDENEMLGDLSGDGELTADDLDIISSAFEGSISLTADQRAQADLDFDGSVDLDDLLLLQNYLSGVISEF